jgi:uncharacterized cupredoxin-like copper-binding protein
LLGALLPSLASAATIPTATGGVATFTGTINDYTGSSRASHFSAAWVTDSSGKFITTLWKQGPDLASKEWGDHLASYAAVRGSVTTLDGFSGATATTYAVPANNPVTFTWNCRDATGKIMPDGDYRFFVQYAESEKDSVTGKDKEGPITTALTWTKGLTPLNMTLPNQGTQGMATGNNFTNMSIVWNPATVAPTITSAAPPATGSQGTAYTHTYTATGSAPIAFTVTSGSLPPGITLSSGGMLSGVPTAAGTFTGTVTADNGLTPATQPFSVEIAQAIVFTNAVPTNGNRVTAINHTCSVIGTAPVTFSVSSGTLPPGLALTSTGVLSGMPTTLGTYTGKIMAHNGLAPDTFQDFSIRISPATKGFVSLIAMISDYTGTSSTTAPFEHNTAVWVTDSTGKFIKTLWRQGGDFTSKEWRDHLPTYNTARGSNAVIDGFTSATAWDYSSAIANPTINANNPIIVNWDCRDANGNLMDDGTYNFFIQYSENQSGTPGPVTTALAWTKGSTASSVNLPAQGTQGSPANGNNFTNISIAWMLAPEIVVEQPEGTSLVDGGGSDFGSSVIDTTGTSKTFTIKNSGSTNLTIPAVTVYGDNASCFAVSPLATSSVAPGTSTTFTVTFSPTMVGSLNAHLQIANNDADESPFDIHLMGTGTPPPAPEILVQQPAGSGLKAGAAKRNFGAVSIESKKGKTITFTVKNVGDAPLTGLNVKKFGNDLKAFVVGDLATTTLAPGASTTLKVTFKPAKKGSRHGGIRILSNDEDENPFDIQLAGQGVK